MRSSGRTLHNDEAAARLRHPDASRSMGEVPHWRLHKPRQGRQAQRWDGVPVDLPSHLRLRVPAVVLVPADVEAGRILQRCRAQLHGSGPVICKLACTQGCSGAPCGLTGL